ncbi:MAG: hypothetical protein ABI342_04150 [Nitrososphaera sp.]|jgi:hypothetical protein
MTNLRRHYKCQPGCMVYTSYIRIKNRWRRIGQYGTKCHQFIPDVLQNDTTPAGTKPPSMPPTEQIQASLPIDNSHQVSDKELSELCNLLGKA